jgi:hypothetical protein
MRHVPASLADPRARAVLELLATHAHVPAAQLEPSMRAEELGLSKLEMALALFDIEDHFDCDLNSLTDVSSPTVEELVQEVLTCVDDAALMRC